MATHNIYFSEESDRLLLTLAAATGLSNSAVIAAALKELARKKKIKEVSHDIYRT